MSEFTLEQALAALGAVAGSVHRRNGEHLELVTEIGLPKAIIPTITTIPKGKGMAGQAWSRRQPTSTCNLKTEQGTSIQPGARTVDANGAVAIPIMDGRDEVVGVVGFAFGNTDPFDIKRIGRCRDVARGVAARYGVGDSL